MKTISTIYCFFILIGSSLYAHKTNEAFFRVIQKESVIEIETEFPWTLRNALLNFRPELERASNKLAYKKALIDYLKVNLVLTDSRGNILKFMKFEQMENMGHSHQNNYRITYMGSSFEKIKNTIMFNIFDNQVNYHRIKANATSKILKTTKDQTTFELLDKKSYSHWWIFALIAVMVSAIILEVSKSAQLVRTAI
jgi:hypothetical protein